MASKLFMFPSRSEMTPPEPKYTGPSHFPGYLDTQICHCACGMSFFLCNEKFNSFYGMAVYDEMDDWYQAFVPVEVEDDIFCSPACAQKYHTQEDDLAAAKGTLIAVVASAAIWAGIILTALHVFRGVSL